MSLSVRSILSNRELDIKTKAAQYIELRSLHFLFKVSNLNLYSSLPILYVPFLLLSRFYPFQQKDRAFCLA